jgi:hypothetical protein
MDLLGILVGLIGLYLLGKLLLGSIAAGMEQAGRRLEEGQGGGAGNPSPQRREPGAPLRSSLLVVGGILALGFAGHRLFGFWSSGADEEPPGAVAASEGRSEPALPELATPEEMERFVADSERVTAASVQRAQVAAAKARQQQVLYLGRKVEEAVAAWEQEMDLWDLEVAGLMTDEEGKALATQEAFVRRYRAIVAEERPDRVEARASAH